MNSRMAIATFVVFAMSLALRAAEAEEQEVVLTLEEAILRAQRGAPAEVIRQAIRGAAAQRSEARSAYLPRFSLRSFVAPSPDIRCANEDCTRTSPENATIDVAGIAASVQLSITQPIYTFGKLDAVGRAAKRVHEATQMMEQALAADVAIKVATAYFGTKLARELRWMLEGGAEKIEKAHSKLVARLSNGEAGATVQDRLRLEILRGEVLIRLSEASESEVVALAAFRALVGESQVVPDNAAFAATPFELAAENGDYVKRASSQRPEVRAARAGLEGQSALVDFERARLWPDIAAFGSLTVARTQGVDDPPSAFANDPFNTTSAAVGVVLRWDVNPFSQLARIERRAADHDQSAARFEILEKQSEFEAHKAFAQAKYARERIDAAATASRSARGWVASVLQADEIGAADAKDFADAYIAFFTSQARVLQSTYEWNLAVLYLRRAIGELAAGSAGP